MLTPHIVPEHLLPDALKALEEGRLAWRCTDAHGRPCNGGTAEPLAVGEWSPRVKPVLCESGWHVTTDPIRWRGTRLWLVECGGGNGGTVGDKTAWESIRPLAEVDPKNCIDMRIFARVANLRWANLSGANLSGADLSVANLRWANLNGANLSVADLSGANLSGANLSGANLSGANLSGANLSGANLSVANLRWADLSGANLRWADLSGADLRWANLSGAYGRDDWDALVARGGLR